MGADEHGPRWLQVPDACTLPAAAQPARAAAFGRVFGRAVRAVERAGPQRLRLGLDTDPRAAAQVAGLMAAETGCCSFFTFVLTATAGRLTLEISVPAAHTEVLDGLANRAAAVCGPPA